MKPSSLIALTFAVISNAAVPQPCGSITAPSVPGASVLTISSTERHNASVPAAGISGLNFCDVNVTLSHPGVNDSVRVAVWLPFTDSWNHRFQATGGGGWLAGQFDTSLAPAVAAGYAGASTDAGVNSVSALDPGSWPFSADGTVNTELLVNFASRSLHDMAVVGKAVTAAYYGTAANFSYWNGCSTGGRQGYMEAQKYPDDFDGILAIAPAINWPKFIVAEFWPQVVMKEEGEFPPDCVFEAFINAAVEKCDPLDGAVDGLISNPNVCHFDASSLIGTKINCNGTSTTITTRQATIFRKILEGPETAAGTRLWYGLQPGAPLSELASATPFAISSSWIADFVKANASFNVSAITYSNLPSILEESYAKYEPIIGTDNPDLSAFKASGGKLLTWHGYNDQLIFPNGTSDYRERVEAVMGGTTVVDSFYRLFFAPGVEHCSGGNGPQPSDPLDALVAWVEQGVAPDTLPASTTTSSGTTVTRNLCRYPKNLKYSGTGDVNLASSWTCV